MMMKVSHALLSNRTMSEASKLAADWHKPENAPPVNLATGAHELDKILGGLCSEQLIIVAGKTGFGKTTFALNLARWLIHQPNTPVLFFSLEMSRHEITNRLLAQESGIPLRITTKQQPAEIPDLHSIEAAIRRLEQASPLLIEDDGELTPTALHMKTRGMQIRFGVKCVVVDYLHMMTSDDPKHDEQTKLAEITRQLKGMAKALKIPVVLLSQLNKSATDDPDIESLRGSGMIANNADKVLFVCAPNGDESFPFDPDVQVTDRLRVKVVKNRQGRTDDVTLAWNKSTNRLDF